MLLLYLPLLTGCWDRLPLRKLNMVDIAAFDIDKENKGYSAYFINTALKGADQGGVETVLSVNQLKAPSLVRAIGQGQYSEKAPFLGITTRTYLLSQDFVLANPIEQLEFLLHTPYSIINCPVVVFDGDLKKFTKTAVKENKELTEEIQNFNKGLNVNNIVPETTMMNFLQSKEDPLDNLMLPVFKQQEDEGLELGGALLFRHGANTGVELNKEQIQMVMTMLGEFKGRQRYTGSLLEESKGAKQTDEMSDKNYAFSVLRGKSSTQITPNGKELPKIKVIVQMDVDVYELGKSYHKLTAKYVNKIEKELNKKFEKDALSAIETMQKANCDLLKIATKIKAHHPNSWKKMDWKKDYSKLKIVPKFDIQIINASSN
ncbi:Ger(x)C family spore germination C-terminal domain-containing protein [Gottfriedia sp. NPDC057991]|uniref:Ger(x)C family spore germination C-terminal domain-containing protein n=1 Tax=Gottfriedia sp. NPDC057991 TaxID=3346298 RepID=UPI0036DA9BCC